MHDFKWVRKAVCLGTVFFLAVWLVKPVGVSTQFSVLAGIFHSALDETVITEEGSTNAYYAKSEGKLAKSIREPWNYDFIFVLAIPFGAYAAYKLNGEKKRSELADVGENPELPESKQSAWRLYLPGFIGGFILLFGARMADGCTSGHMMSGMMQGSVSGYIFAAAVFLTAIPTAIIAGRINGGGR